MSELSYCLHNYQNRHFVGVLEVFPRVFRTCLINFSLYFRFESQERQNTLSTQPAHEVSSHVPSRRSYTVRRVQQIVQHYRDAAGLEATVHPHVFRHQMLTFLTGQKLSDAQIQLLSGHASKQSLEVYQHLSLEAVEEA